MTENPVIEVLNQASQKAGSQAAFARIIGVHQSAITHWKERGYFPAKQIAKIAAFAGLPQASIQRLSAFIVAQKVARYEKILEKRVADRAKGA